MKSRLIAMVVAATAMCVPARADLDVGDAAPALKIKDWIRGDAVNLAKDAAKKIHMIEFWATWCPPCKASVPLLTDFQKKHKDLVIVGVTDADPYRNSVGQIKDFVKEQGDKMAYTVAIDDDGTTTKAYMPSEVAGIPYAFLVGRDGKVVWHGSPLDPALETVIPEVISGKYDVGKAKARADLDMEVDRRFQTLELAYQMGQREAVWEGVVDILRIDPANDMAMQIMTSLYTDDPKKADAFKKWARDHIAKHKTSAVAMTRLAQALLDNPDLSTRTPDLALEAAKAAYDGSQQREAAPAGVYGRALYQVGDLDRAISVQKDVIGLVSGEDKDVAQRILAFYEQCKKLQGDELTIHPSMQRFEKFESLITAERERRDNFHTLLSCVVPRPIAFVSTLSASGVANLAPFSFFNGVGSNPPAVVFSPCTRADGTSKDTIINLRANPECVVNVVPFAIKEAMNQASYAYPPEVSEFSAAGFTPLASKFVRPARVAESPVQMECRLLQIVPVGDGPLSANICVCEVLCFHIAREIYLPDGTADVSKIDLVARLGGDDYSTIRDRFALPKPALK